MLEWLALNTRLPDFSWFRRWAGGEWELRYNYMETEYEWIRKGCATHEYGPVVREYKA